MSSAIQASRSYESKSSSVFQPSAPPNTPLTLTIYQPPVDPFHLKPTIAGITPGNSVAFSVFKNTMPPASPNSLSLKERTHLLIEKIYPSNSIESVFDSTNKEICRDIKDILSLKEAFKIEDPILRQSKLVDIAMYIENIALIPLLAKYLDKIDENVKSQELVKVGLEVQYAVLHTGSTLCENLINYGAYVDAADLVNSMDSYLEFLSIGTEDPLNELTQEIARLKLHFIELFIQCGKHNISLSIAESLTDPVIKEDIKQRITLRKAIQNELKSIFTRYGESSLEASLLSKKIVQSPEEYQNFIENLIINKKYNLALALSMKLEMGLCLLNFSSCNQSTHSSIEDSIAFFKNVIFTVGKVGEMFIEHEQYDKAMELGLTLGSSEQIVNYHPLFENEADKTKSLSFEAASSKNTLCAKYIDKMQFSQALALAKTIPNDYFRADLSRLFLSVNRPFEAEDLAKTLIGTKFNDLHAMIQRGELDLVP